MTVAAILGTLAGLGFIGVVKGLHPAPPPLESISATMNKPSAASARSTAGLNVSITAGKRLVDWVGDTAVASHPTWLALFPSLAITGESPEGLASKMLVVGGAGLLGPPNCGTGDSARRIPGESGGGDSDLGHRCPGGSLCPRCHDAQSGARPASSFPHRDWLIRRPGRAQPGGRRRNRGCIACCIAGERRLGGNSNGEGPLDGTRQRAIAMGRFGPTRH